MVVLWKVACSPHDHCSKTLPSGDLDYLIKTILIRTYAEGNFDLNELELIRIISMITDYQISNFKLTYFDEKLIRYLLNEGKSSKFTTRHQTMIHSRKLICLSCFAFILRNNNSVIKLRHLSTNH